MWRYPRKINTFKNIVEFMTINSRFLNFYISFYLKYDINKKK
ncbi:TPA: hypothetical protein QCX48_003643 [Bacillus mycoides]|nr:hypothetical protein [Bacillus mycoides]